MLHQEVQHLKEQLALAGSQADSDTQLIIALK
jgi:hypothetical protein